MLAVLLFSVGILAIVSRATSAVHFAHDAVSDQAGVFAMSDLVPLAVQPEAVSPTTGGGPGAEISAEPGLVLRDPVTLVPEDADGDGLANQLVASISIRVSGEGFYRFTLRAENPVRGTETQRQRYLVPGDYDLRMGLSGIMLQPFSGDANVTLRAVRISTSTVDLEWVGQYRMPSPSIFQTAPSTGVTLVLQGDLPLIGVSIVILHNRSNAYTAFFLGGPSLFSGDVPQLTYTVLAAGSDSENRPNQGALMLSTPAPSPVAIPVSRGGRTADSATLEFDTWGAGSLWRNRTIEDLPATRIHADSIFDPDDVVTDEEIGNWFQSGSYLDFPALELLMDGLSPALAEAGEVLLGAGPAVSELDIGAAERWDLSAPFPEADVHDVTLTLSRQHVDVTASATLRVPAGWSITTVSAAPEVAIKRTGAQAVRLDAPSGEGGVWVVTVRAEFVLSRIEGNVVDVRGEHVVGARVALTNGSMEVAQIAVGEGGTFRFDNLAPGDYRLVLEAPGYVSRELPISVGPGETSRLGNVVLAPVEPAAGLDPILFVGLSIAVLGAASGVATYVVKTRMRNRGGPRLRKDK